MILIVLVVMAKLTAMFLALCKRALLLLVALQPAPATPFVNTSPALLPDLQALGWTYHKTGAGRLDKVIKAYVDKNPTLANEITLVFKVCSLTGPTIPVVVGRWPVLGARIRPPRMPLRATSHRRILPGLASRYTFCLTTGFQCEHSSRSSGANHTLE